VTRPALSRAAWAVAAALGALTVFGVAVAARSRASAPVRCGRGMIALGPRCCGAGQTLEDGDRCAGAATSCAAPLAPSAAGCTLEERVVPIAGGELVVGPGDWEAQGQVAPRTLRVAAFRLDAFETTEGAWSRCVAERACPAVASSREPFRAIAGVTLAEARRFCATRGGTLPTADQLIFAAAGPHGRRYPWGETGAVCRRAAWGLAHGPCAERARGPELVGSHPDGATTEGVFDLAGNVAEWTEPSAPNAATTRVFGGSWADSEAAALRSYRLRPATLGTRSPEIGFRCAYPAGGGS
jgi:formylglycine-generating enzyme required for sulfatase activity